MLKRELKLNLKGFLLWSGILIAMFLVVFAIYPSLVNSESMKDINQLLEVFPIEVLKAFNMDISGIDTAYGWLKSEGYIFILLVTSAYAGILGGNIVLKEESDKTIEYLNSLPVSRKQIVVEKIKCCLFYIIMMILFVGIVNYICLMISGDFDQKQYLWLMIAPILPAMIFFGLSLAVSTYFHKSRNMMPISIGLVFISYFIQVVANMSEKVEFLQYFSIFTLADTRNILENGSLALSNILLALGISLLLIVYSIYRYIHKDLI